MEINIKNLSYSYKKVNYQERIIFNKLNMNLKDGINFVIGANGTGKTTLLNLVSGELKTESIEMPKRVKIGFIKGNPEFVAETVREELINSMLEHNYQVSEKRIIDVLLMVGIDIEKIDTSIKSLSLFDKKLLSLASALIYNPNLILIDNFTEELDDFNKNKIIKLIKMLKTRYNKTFLIASNDLEFVNKIADKVFVLYDKKVVMHGNKYDVFKCDDKLKKYNVDVPNIIKFENMVLKTKNIRLGYRDEINDLIKDIYRHSY
ncbi:MAG: energy-coupling factor ABC transporter ATP-binding protein [Bacilli bacterium]|nr:energy-coupling factor ABC transporter ATP-binding protein [Bacilli bacterium]